VPKIATNLSMASCAAMVNWVDAEYSHYLTLCEVIEAWIFDDFEVCASDLM
jgi:UDP-N-acetylenolpyruvoylglucosamine reductase